MGAPDLLQGLRRAGFSLSVSRSGDLAVKPASKLTDDQRAAIKAHKVDILQALQSQPQAFDVEAYEERAAIIEHDGGLSRDQAEAMAAEINCEPLDPDRHCWPHTGAMNTAEIDAFTARLDLFTRHGLDMREAEGLADALVVRDRQADDRRLCLECSHMRRNGGVWRCGQWQRTGLAVADVPGVVVQLLQRCGTFNEATK